MARPAPKVRGRFGVGEPPLTAGAVLPIFQGMKQIPQKQIPKGLAALAATVCLAVAAVPAMAQVELPPSQAPDVAPMLPAPAPLAPTPRSGEQQRPGAPSKPGGGAVPPGAETPETAKKDGKPSSGPEQREKVLEELYGRLATAPDEETATQVANAIEQLWQHSGSATADLLMARAAAATEQGQRDLAMKLLNATVELQPDYAEAWNRRAYLFYLADDYTRALGDIRRVLALEPQHFKAIEGLANILHHLDEKKSALEAYESLLKVHPNAPGARKAADDLRNEVEGRGI